MEMNVTLSKELGKKFTIADSARERQAQQMIDDGPVDLGFREWVANMIELGATKASIEIVNVNGVNKLALLDNGKGMPPLADPDKISLDVFTSELGIGDEDTKDMSKHGNQNRGFRFAWTSASPEGIMIFSKEAGKPCYRAVSRRDEHGDFGQMLGGVLEVDTPEIMSDSGTLVVIMGNSPEHDTAAEHWVGAENLRHGGQYLSNNLIARRFWNIPPTLKLTMDRLLGQPIIDVNSYASIIKPLNELVTNPRHIKDVTTVTTDEGVMIHYIDRRKGRFLTKQATLIGNANIGSFGALVYNGEIYQMFEGADGDVGPGWKTHGAHCGIGVIGDKVSVVVDLSQSAYDVASSYDRKDLKFNGPYRLRDYAQFGPDVVALRAFKRIISDNRPDWVVAMMENANDIDDDDSAFKEAWKRRVDQLKLRFMMPGNPAPNGPGGFRFVMPMPLVADGHRPDPTPNDDDKTGKYDPKSKNRVIGDVQDPVVKFEQKGVSKNATMYPIRYDIEYDPEASGWSCTIWINEDSRYYGLALNAAVNAKGRLMNAVLHPMNATGLNYLRRSLLSAAREVFGPHYLWAVMHANEINDPEKIVEWLELDEIAAQTMGHFVPWLDMIERKNKTDAKAQALFHSADVAFLELNPEGE